MTGNVEILKEATSGFKIDLSALVAQALRRKQEQEAAKYAEIEETPPDKALTWRTTPEQIARINAGEREAIDEFFFEKENARRIRCCVWSFFRRSSMFRSIVSDEDLINQFYVDLRTGLLKLRPYDKAISGALYHSFRYAAVGGIDELYIYKAKELRQCQKAAN